MHISLMRIFAIALVLNAQVVPAHAQNTKAAISSQISTSFPDQLGGFITPADQRALLNNLVNSYQQFTGVNPQAGTTYTIATTDYGQLVTLNNNSAVAVTLPQATGSFTTFNVYVENLGNGTATITPVAGTIGGSSALNLTTGQSAWIVSDGTNYQTVFTGGGGGGGGTPGGSSTQVQFNNSGSFGGQNTLTWVSPVLVIGALGTSTGVLQFKGLTGGTIAILPQNTAGTYNFNLPNSAGTSGQPLLSGGGGSNAMTFGSLAINQLATIAADNLIANATGSTAAPTAVPIGNCTGGGSALNYSTSTHLFSCNIISGSGSVIAGTIPGQLAYYVSATNVVQGNTNAVMNAGTLTLGTANATLGSLVLEGSSSGALTLAPLVAAGTPTVTFGVSSGTAAVVGVAPLTIASATGAISITGTAGAVLGGAGATFTQTPTLGSIGGATGALNLSGLASGTVKLTTSDAAGTWTMKLPTTPGVNGQFLTTDGGTPATTTWANVAGSGTVISGLAGQLAYYSGSGASVSGNSSANISAGALTLGQINTVVGSLILNGSSSGAVTITPGAAAAGTFNFNLPTAAGTAGQFLLSGGGGSAAMTWTTNANITAGALTLGTASTTLGSLILEGSGSGAVTLTPQATAGTPTLTLPNTTGTLVATAAAPLAINATTGQITLTQTLPTISVCTTSGTSCNNGGFGGAGTYTTPVNVKWVKIRLVGAGGGGGGSGSSGNTDGGAGGNTCWNTSGAACTSPVLQGSGGGGTGTAGGGPGGAGAATGGNILNAPGASGSFEVVLGGNQFGGGNGGSSCFAGSGPGGITTTAGSAGGANTGGGGGGGGAAALTNGGGGGGAGGCVEHLINTPAATYTYAVGAAGTAGSAGTSGHAGGAGSAGYIVVEEHYGT